MLLRPNTEMRSAVAGELDFVFAVGGAGLPMWGVMAPAAGGAADTNSVLDYGGGEDGNQSLTGNWEDGQWVTDGAACRQRPQGCWREAAAEESQDLSFQEYAVDALIAGFGTFKHQRLIEQGFVEDQQSCGPPLTMTFGLIQTERGFGAACDLTAGVESCVPIDYALGFCQADLYAGRYDAKGDLVEPLSEHQRLCCLALQLKSASTTAGRFSVKTFEQESVEESISVWNPGCQDILGPQEAWGGNPAPYNNLLEAVSYTHLTLPTN